MAKFYKNPFAFNGDFEAIADGTQSNGKISNEDGFTSDYELLKSDPNYRPVGRKEMNGIFNEITGALHQIQTQGAAEFEEDFEGYKKGAVVKFYDEIYFLTTDEYEPTLLPDEQPEWLLLNILSGSKTVTVGTGGDFPSLSGALHYAKGLIVPISSFRLEIKILSGYVWQQHQQLLLDGVDLGFVDITAEGTVEINSSLIAQSLEPGCKPAFGAKNGGVLPVIKAKFQFTNNTDRARHGVAVLSGGKAVIGTGGGFLNAPGASLYADGLGSEIVAQSGYDASGSSRGILAKNAARVQADGMMAALCECTIEAESGAAVYARNATLTNSPLAIKANTGCKVDAREADIVNTQKIQAVTGGEVIVDQADISSGGLFMFDADAAKISANDATVRIQGYDDPNDLIYLTRGAEIRLCNTGLQIQENPVQAYPLPSYATANTISSRGIIWSVW